MLLQEVTRFKLLSVENQRPSIKRRILRGIRVINSIASLSIVFIIVYFTEFTRIQATIAKQDIISISRENKAELNMLFLLNEDGNLGEIRGVVSTLVPLIVFS